MKCLICGEEVDDMDDHLTLCKNLENDLDNQPDPEDESFDIEDEDE